MKFKITKYILINVQCSEELASLLSTSSMPIQKLAILFHYFWMEKEIDFSKNSGSIFLKNLIEHFGYSAEETTEQVQNPPCEPQEFQDLLQQGAELLMNNDIQAFINCLLEISRILEVYPEYTDFLNYSYLGFRLSMLGNPNESSPKIILLISDLLTNFTANDRDYSTRLIQTNELMQKDSDPGFFASHLSILANQNVTYIYAIRVIPVLYNIASDWDVNNICKIEDLSKLFAKIENDNELSFVYSFFFINVFRASKITDQSIANMLKKYSINYILHDNEISINIAWCLYYFCVNSELLLIVDEEFMSLIENMLNSENESFQHIAISILSIIPIYTDVKDDQHIKSNIMQLLNTFDLQPLFQFAQSLDQTYAAASISAITNLSIFSETLFMNVINSNFFDLILNLLADSPLLVKNYSVCFFGFAISHNSKLCDDFITEDNLDLLIDLCKIESIAVNLLQSLDIIMTSHPDVIPFFIDNNILEKYESIELDPESQEFLLLQRIRELIDTNTNEEK